jgi:hypothetical protein
MKSAIVFTIVATLWLVVLLGAVDVLMFGGRYTNAWNIRWQLQRLPGVRVVEVQPSDGDYSVSTIEVLGKGQMTFSGWSLRLGQFSQDNTHPIGLSQIGECKIQVIKDGSYREWVVLNREEIGVDILNVNDAIKNYDLIIREIKSWPKISNHPNRLPGRYSDCP